MPLKVPNYRAVSELFRKKPSEPPTLSQAGGDGVAGVNKNPLPKPSGASNHTFQMPVSPRNYVVPLPAQTPRKAFHRWRKPSTQSSTIPLSAPLSDPRLDSLIDAFVSRRYAISKALGEPRATNFIDKSAAYRQANPEIFKGVYDGGNIDRIIKVRKNDEFMAPDGQYWPAIYNKNTNEVHPARIEVRGDNPFSTLMHELFHLDTSGLRPQDVEGAYRDLQKGKVVKPVLQMLYTRFRPVGSRTGRDAKVITDRSYFPEGRGSNRSEMGSQLGALRVHLEQLGIDTSNKEELRKALSTMGDDPRIMHNFEAQRIHRALNDPTLSPEQRERGLDALVELMPGIAKADTTQYPYKKVASDPSSPLRGLTIMSTISALLKGR